jgi:hypothetical protein
MICRKWYISTGFRGRPGAWRHVLIALRWPMRFAYVRPDAKPEYRRVYIGPVEIEWSR